MLRKLGKRAQTTAEYAILIAIVVGAVVAMQVYVRRGLQARVKDAVDKTEGDIFTTKQYEPYYVDTSIDSTRDVKVTENIQAGGSATKTIEGEDVSSRTGYQKSELGTASNE